MVTIKDVAKRADVSVATVSYVLNGRKKFSKKTEDKVKKSAKELNYRPNISARTLRRGRGNNIGLVLPNISNPWFSELAHNIIVEAQKKHLLVTIFTTLYDQKMERDALKTIEQSNMLACLMVPTANKVFEDMVVPLLLLDREAGDYPCISFDNYRGGFLQAEHALTLNVKNVLILGNPTLHSSSEKRLKGITDCLKGKVDFSIIHQDFIDELSDNALKGILSKKYDAVICVADIIASAVIRIAAENDIHIPKEMSLIGFDDIYYASILQPPLTTIAQDSELLAKTALSEVVDFVNGKKKVIKFTSQELPTRLIERKSTLIKKT